MSRPLITWIVLGIIAVTVSSTSLLFFFMLNGTWYYGEQGFWLFYTYASLALTLVVYLKPKFAPISAALLSPFVTNIVLKCETVFFLNKMDQTVVSSIALAISGFLWVALYFYFFFHYFKKINQIVFLYLVLIAGLVPVAHDNAQQIKRDAESTFSEPRTGAQ